MAFPESKTRNTATGGVMRWRGDGRGLNWATQRALFLAVALAVPALVPAQADDALSQQNLARIRVAAMHSDYAQQELRSLAQGIGPRLSGTPQARAAREQIADSMRKLGLVVSEVPASVPHWEPGTATAALLRYPGQSKGAKRKLTVAALGNSPATPKSGLTATVLVVHGFEDLRRHAAKVRGRIVVFDIPFEQLLADNGYAATAYARVVRYRLYGPARAARLGAVAALVRTAGGGGGGLVHTGASVWPSGTRRIPAAAIIAADADMIAALAARGAVRLRLNLSAHSLKPVMSADVVGELRGTVSPDEVVLVSGHWDSWYLGQGAQDDATGVAVALGVADVFRQLDLRPRRSVRFVAWANEENGLSGAHAYAKAMAGTLSKHVAAIENDTGAGRPFGIAAQLQSPSASLLGAVFDALKPIGVTLLMPSTAPVSADLAPLSAAGVPGFAPLVDMRHYFDVHHSAADTLAEIEPENVRRQVALEAVLAWWLANADPLPRLSTVNPVHRSYSGD